jgi:hypothetical protein
MSLTDGRRAQRGRTSGCVIYKRIIAVSLYHFCTVVLRVLLLLLSFLFYYLFIWLVLFPFSSIALFSQRLVSISANIENNKKNRTHLLSFLASQKYYCRISSLTSLYTSSFYTLYIQSLIYYH